MIKRLLLKFGFDLNEWILEKKELRELSYKETKTYIFVVAFVISTSIGFIISFIYSFTLPHDGFIAIAKYAINHTLNYTYIYIIIALIFQVLFWLKNKH